MTKEIIHVPPTDGFDIVYAQGPFDQGLASLREEKVSLWSAEELARLRVQLGAAHPVSQRWSWVAENFNYVTDAEADILIALAAQNPIIKDPARAVQAHREGREVYLTDTVFRELRDLASPDPDMARQTGVYRLTRDNVRAEIPATALDEYGPTRFLLGAQAKPYGKFLQESGIQTVHFYTVGVDYIRNPKHEGQTLGRALWVSDLLNRSSLYGNFNDLHYVYGRVGGVRPHAREAGALEARVER